MSPRRAFAAWTLLVGALTFPLAPLVGHASARAYHAGRGGVVPEAPAMFSPLLLFDEPAAVYAAYGRLWLVAFVTFLVAALLLRREEVARLPPRDRRAFAVLLAGLAALVPGNLGDYWLGPDVLGSTGWGASFLVTMLGLLAVMAGSVWLGATGLRRGGRARAMCVALLAAPTGVLVNAWLVPNAPAAFVPVLALPWMLDAWDRLRPVRRGP